MMWLVKLAVHVVVFGVALTFATRKVKGVKVTPPAALPLVALTFALLNAGLYWLVSFAVKVVTLWTLALVAPLIANAVILFLTDALMKPLKIESMKALLYASGVMTIAHLLLRLSDSFL